MKNPEMCAPEGQTAEYERVINPVVEERITTILKNELAIDPIRENYATLPIEESFDWQEVLEKITEFREFAPDTKLFVFAFRSTPLADRDPLAVQQFEEADLDAFSEAMYNFPDEFLYYFRGDTDTNGNCLSFCVWTSQEASTAVHAGKAHRRAARLAKSNYELAQTEGHWVQQAEKGGEVVFLPEPKSTRILIPQAA